LATGINERLWLEWLVKVRIIIITVLLAIELAIVNLTATNVDRALFVLVILGWYASAAVFLYLFYRRKGSPRWQSRAQLICDLCFTTAVVYVTGGIDTRFVFLYPILIIVASTLLSDTWAYLTAAISFVFFGAVLELSYFGLVHSYSTSEPDLKSMQAVIFIYFFAFATIAYLANRLANRMRQAEVELKNKSHELESLQALHEIIVRSISSGLITTDLDGAVMLANPAARQLLGLGDEEMAGAAAQQFFLDVLPVPGMARCEVRAQTPQGVILHLGIGCSELHGTHGDLIGHVYTFTDLTEVRHLERELRQRDRLAAVGRMASGIAHEIRNPLSSIAGSVTMLASVAPLTEGQSELVDIVTRESERLNNIIGDFLSYSRDRDMQGCRVDLAQLLTDTLTLLEHRPSEIQIERSLAQQEAFTIGDGDKLKQVFWNLCSNALRAMSGGGTLTVSLDQVGEHWRICFRDTGSGIPPNLLEKLFEPFQSGFEGGTGLGLAIVYRIMQAHDAQITVSSEQDKGTTFTLLFRRAAEEVRDRAAVPMPLPGNRELSAALRPGESQ
jgi:two-component system sensor histidine kinase PilS (NtrC family)